MQKKVMKQFGTFILMLSVLFLMGCGDGNSAQQTETAQPEEVAETAKTGRKEEKLEDSEACGSYVYSVFDGVYKAKLSNENATESFVLVRGFNDFILLEYFDLYEGSVFSFYAEEVWPDESGYISDEITSVIGMSQCFSLMSSKAGYFDLPQNRCITITDDGIVLNYDDADAEYYDEKSKCNE